MLVFLVVLYKNGVVQVVCAYRLALGLFQSKIGINNSLIYLDIGSSIFSELQCAQHVFKHAFINVVTII